MLGSLGLYYQTVSFSPANVQYGSEVAHVEMHVSNFHSPLLHNLSLSWIFTCNSQSYILRTVNDYISRFRLCEPRALLRLSLSDPRHHGIFQSFFLISIIRLERLWLKPESSQRSWKSGSTWNWNRSPANATEPRERLGLPESGKHGRNSVRNTVVNPIVVRASRERRYWVVVVVVVVV